MKAQGSTGVEALDLQVGRLVQRERLNQILLRLVWGLFIGGAAGALYAVVTDFIPLPFPPLAAAVCGAAAGALAGVLVGVLTPLSPLPLLIKADKALDNHELSSTAFELASHSKKSIFSEAIIEDAVRSLSGADPAKILRRPRMKLLPFLPLVLAASLLLSLFPMDLAALFSPKAVVEPAMRSIGEDLEAFGKRLEKKAAEENLQRMLELSQELQRLGQDFQNESLDQSEAQQRLQELESRLAEQYAMKVEEMLKNSDAQGQEGSDQASAGKGTKDGTDQKQGNEGDQEASGQDGEAATDAESQDLSEALNMLSQKRQSLSMPPSQSKPGTSSGAGQTAQGSADRSEQGDAGQLPSEGGGDGSEKSTGTQSQPGTTPMQDIQGPESDIARAQTGDSLQAQVPLTQGETMQMLMRALPRSKGSTVPDREELRSYQRTAETTLAREDVPVSLREYVREYFIAIGMMGRDNQGR